jgi:gliding motility-associated-like protein
MLIAQKGTACADTTFETVCVNFLAADNSFNNNVCVGTPVTFTDMTSFGTGSNITSWNWNFGDGQTSILPNPTHTYNSSGTFNVTLIVTSNVGCVDTIVKIINVQGLPVANAGPDLNACINNPLVQLNGIVSNATGGIWLNGTGIYNPNNTTLNAQYTPTATEVSNGVMYLVLATTGNGVCPADDDSLQITFVPGPTVDAGPDIQVCKDSTGIPLNGTVTVAGGGLWSTTGTGSFSPSPTVLNPTYNPSNSDTAAGTITFYLTSTLNGNCIPTTDTMQMTFYDPPALTLTTNDTVCTGQPVQLTANITTGQGYWQTNGTGTFIPDSLLNSYYMPSAGDAGSGSVWFYFTSTNNGGCKAVRDSLDVAVIPSPDPAYTTDSVCFTNPTTFINNSSAVGGISGYFWNFGDGGTSTLQNPTYTFLNEGTQNVYLVVTSNNGCRDTAFIPVTVHYLPDVAFTNPTQCLVGGTPFQDQTSVINSTVVSWDWSFGDGGTSTIQNPVHQYPSSGTYPVTLVAMSAFGCVDSLTQNTTVLPPPVADFSMSNNSINPFTSVTFTDASTPPPIVAWQWDFGDGSGTSSSQNPSYAYNNAGIFTVTLVVTDTNGCIDSVQRDLIVFLPPFVPSGFSPTGDGTNDILYVLGGPFKELIFRVYNNWGELIFESTDQAYGWDGTYQGVAQPIGVYVWTVYAVSLDDAPHELKGDVTLLR